MGTNTEHDSIAEDNGDTTSAPVNVTQPVSMQAPIDAAMRRGNGPRPRTQPQTLREAEPLTQPSPTLDPRVLTAVEGYGEDMKPYIAGAETALSTLYEGVKQVIAARDASMRNPTFNEAGAIIATAQLADKVQDKALKLADGAIKQLGRTIAEVDSMLRTPLEAGANAGTVASEIRAHAKGLSTTERQKLITTSVDKGDARTVSALLGAPGFLSGLTDEQVATFTLMFNRKRYPQEARKLEVMKQAKERLEAAGSLFIAQVEKAMAVKGGWGTAQRLREAKTEAEKAFAVGGA